MSRSASKGTSDIESNKYYNMLVRYGASLRKVRHDWQKIAMLMFAELRAAEVVMAAAGGDDTDFVKDAVHEALDIFRSRTTISAVMVDPDFHLHS